MQHEPKMTINKIFENMYCNNIMSHTYKNHKNDKLFIIYVLMTIINKERKKNMAKLEKDVFKHRYFKDSRKAVFMDSLIFRKDKFHRV